MSHKSSKQPPVRKPGSPGATTPAAETEPKQEEGTFRIPKGVPRWQFLLLIGLMIFLLITFLIPGAIQNISRRSGRENPVIVRWKGAEWRASDGQQVRRTLKDAIQVDPLAGFQIGIDPRNPEDTQLLRAMVLNRMALEAGVDVTDADLAEHLHGMLELQRWTSEDFKNVVRSIPADQRT